MTSYWDDPWSKLAAEMENAQDALRARYAAILAELPVELIGEREFRDIVVQLTRMGGSAALQALKGLGETRK